MTSQKKRKKSTTAVTTDVISSEPTVAVLDTATQEEGEDHLPVIEAEIVRSDFQPARIPAWIDGAPVDPSGKIIRKGSPTAQMDLDAQHDQSDGEQAGSPQQSGPRGRNWSDPYKTIFTCPEMGFELGENRQFKQRVFRFSEKPSTAVLDRLKEEGFIYRGGMEKAWTIPATPETRRLTDEMAREWAGPNYVRGIER